MAAEKVYGSGEFAEEIIIAIRYAIMGVAVVLIRKIERYQWIRFKIWSVTLTRKVELINEKNITKIWR